MTTTEALERAAVPPLFYGSADGPSLWTNHGAAEHVFNDLIKKFGISKYLFAHLLGFQHQNAFRRYFNGTSRPSSTYLLRTIVLERWHEAGFELCLMKKVWWESDPIVITWGDGSESSPSIHTGRWENVPTPLGKPEANGPGKHRQRERQATAHTPRRPDFRQRSAPGPGEHSGTTDSEGSLYRSFVGEPHDAGGRG